jgi:Tfp pilus assembly protein FimV
VQWLNELSKLCNGKPKSTPLSEEVDRHKLLLTVKFLNKAQHEATHHFLRLPRVVSTLTMPRASTGSSTASNDGTASRRSERAKKRDTLEGQTMTSRSALHSQEADANPRGKKRARSMVSTPVSSQREADQKTEEKRKWCADSGPALEQRIFGGHLKHRRLIQRGPFQEMSTPFYSFV